MAKGRFGSMMDSLRTGPGARGYMDAVTPGATKVQNALIDLIGPNKTADLDSIRARLGDFAASEKMLNLLRAMPAAGAVYGATLIPDVVDQAAGDLGLTDKEESFANTPMDLLGMGVGAYGMNRGVNRLGGTTSAGRWLATAAGAGLGKLTSDVATGVFG